jgi:Transposase
MVVILDGCGAPAVRGDRLLQEGCEGLYSSSGPRTQTSVIGGDDLGCDDVSDPGVARAPDRGKVTCVVIESTSDYWKPFYYLLDDELDMMLVNASRVRNVPGRKTDVSDAAWLADLGAHGLVTASFVPPPPIRQLRDLTRARTAITRERAREAQWLEKLLEDAGIPMSGCRWPPTSRGCPGGRCSRP